MCSTRFLGWMDQCVCTDFQGKEFQGEEWLTEIVVLFNLGSSAQESFNEQPVSQPPSLMHYAASHRMGSKINLICTPST